MVASEPVSTMVVHGKAPITLWLHRHGRICARRGVWIVTPTAAGRRPS